MILLLNKPIASPIRFCSNVPTVIASKPKIQDIMAIKGVLLVSSDGEITTTTPEKPIIIPSH